MRYEDISFNTEKLAREVLDFFHLTYVKAVEKFLATHTQNSKGGVSSTFRDSKTAPIHWVKDLTFAEVNRVDYGHKFIRKKYLGKSIYSASAGSHHVETFIHYKHPPQINIFRCVNKHY